MLSGREAGADPWWRGLQAGLTRNLAAERLRWPNWLPVLMGTGIALYFALPSEPAPWSAVAALAAALLLFCFSKPGQGLRLLAVAALAVSLGYAAAIWRSHDVAAPRLGDELPPRDVAGRVIGVDVFSGSRYRLLLDRLAIEGLNGSETPARARITVRIASAPPQPGDMVSLRAGLLPPAGPAEPGAYDFGQSAWFERLGALGYAVSAPLVTEHTAPGWRQTLGRWRHVIANRLRAAAPGQRGAVAAAIITGDRSGVSDETAEALRLSGIAHLLAISGLHLGLVTGIFFVLLRALLALSSHLALNYPIKKWAAGAAILAAGVYTLLAGMPIPTERAFVMTGLVLLAVILDRTAISMRLVAVAAGLILLFLPESLLNVSFQMSFAAVVALIAFYEAVRGRSPEPGRWPRWALYLAGLAGTSIVAGFATGLYGAYHFNHFANYGLVTNLVAVPVMAFWVMPWGVVTMLLMPFGLEGWGITPMGWGIDAIIWSARTVAGWPGAVWLTPAFGSGALVLMTLGGLWLALWRRPWRYWGAVPLLAGLAVAVFTPRADILTNGDGSMIALRTPEGLLSLNTRRGSRIVRETWLERDGQPSLAVWPEAGEGGDWLTCDDWGCVYRRAGVTVAIPTARQAIFEDCRMADMVIADFPLPDDCRPPLGTIDRFDVWRSGPHAIRLKDGTAHIDTVAAHQGDRPWSRRPGQ